MRARTKAGRTDERNWIDYSVFCVLLLVSASVHPLDLFFSCDLYILCLTKSLLCSHSRRPPESFLYITSVCIHFQQGLVLWALSRITICHSNVSVTNLSTLYCCVEYK